MLYIVLLISIFFSFNCYAGTIDPNVPDKEYLTYAKDFPFVGKICGTNDDNTEFCGSFTAIENKRIITAAHVVLKMKRGKVFINNRTIRIDKIICHKDFDENKTGKFDIAIGYLDEDIGLNYYPDLYTEDNEVGKICSIVGIGFTGTFISGAHKYDNQLRAGSNIIDYISDHVIVCSPSRVSEKSKTSLEFLIASGDSGGGLFINQKLAGVNSFVMARDKKTDSSYSDEGCHTRISIFSDWIKKNK